MQNKHKKICIVSISLGKGGAERSCAMLSQMLVAEGFEVHIIILNNEVDYPYAGTLVNLGALKNTHDNALKQLSRFRKFRKYLVAQKFDVIIDHCPKNNVTRDVFYDRYLYKGFNRIYVVHSSKKDQYFANNTKKLVKIYNKNIMNVAVSKYIETELLVKNGIQKTRTIRNAYDPNWSEMVSEKPSELKDKKYILAYGRIEDKIKDFTFLIQSFSASRIWEQKVYLVILGDGKDKENLQEFASQQAGSDFILFLPFTESPFQHIANAECVTLTSKYEGFPMILVESLSLGTPVVSLDIVSGPSEIVKHQENGLLISKRSIPLFAEALQKMCFDTQFQKHCQANAKASVQQFSMEEIAKQWSQLIHNELR
ncbi:glycosyltransferase involved in cell wall biosynthesis [Ulvibacter sp. MAR_2010_11]|uniref:glycosyltransferase n=1 Tax=Ulvibacter sp. MAR_2010_11 TaxID=1250229 RepID=UPI000C2B9E97|nr:glycosyltransferase [Ulvibacter sp. MAR_2010_11]PKA83624.1 glycosyltransferase involved in cell wall biosynthesis [Ulvibacter sp. MAR_2010_11]